jgi:TIR domain
VLNPGKFNIYKYFFIAAGGFIILAFVLWAVFDCRPKDLVKFGVLPAALSMFILGLLTWLTRPRRPDDERSKAQAPALGLLDEFAQSELGHLLTGGATEVVQIAKLIDSGNLTERGDYKSRLDGLYKLAPACALPRNYRESKRPILDWHTYDLCIIAAEKDIDLANQIKNKLLEVDKGLRVYLDVTGSESVGEPQRAFIRKVFYASSRKCLALLSIHSVSDPRRRTELGQALLRAQVESASCRDYLFPVPIDREGLASMKGDPFLSEYAEDYEIIRNQKLLFNAIINKLLKLLPVHNPPGLPPDPDKPKSSKRFAVALSFPGEYRRRVKDITEELKKRLHDEEVFYDSDYEYEMVGPNLDIRLQAIYRHHSELLVVFLCKEYVNKRFCRLEWTVVREFLDQEQSPVMLLSFDNTPIEGLSTNHGYSDCEHRRADEIAELIIKKLNHIRIRQS